MYRFFSISTPLSLQQSQTHHLRLHSKLFCLGRSILAHNDRRQSPSDVIKSEDSHGYRQQLDPKSGMRLQLIEGEMS